MNTPTKCQHCSGTGYQFKAWRLLLDPLFAFGELLGWILILCGGKLGLDAFLTWENGGLEFYLYAVGALILVFIGAFFILRLASKFGQRLFPSCPECLGKG